MQKKKKKKRGRKAAVIIIVVVIILLVLGVAYLALRQIGRLDREASRIARMDMAEEVVDRTVYASGGYGQVEDTIKAYMEEYVNTLQAARGVLQEEEFSNLLSADNLEADEPGFEASLAYLEEKQAEADADFEKLLKMAEEEEIMAAIEGKGINAYFRFLYRREMLDTLQPAMFTEEELQTARDSINASIESRRELLTFLAEQQEHWELVNGRVNFDADELLNQYNALAEAVS